MNVAFSLPSAALSQYIFGPAIFILSLFMVLLILVQRGKGGGLTGALGGPGGQSAFGTKAGDLFTRITIVVATVWIFLLAFAVWWYTESDFGAALADNEPIASPASISAPSNGSSIAPAALESGDAGATAAPGGETPAAPAESTPPADPQSPSADASKESGPITIPEAAAEPSSSEASPVKAEIEQAVPSSDSPPTTTQPEPASPTAAEASQIPVPEK